VQVEAEEKSMQQVVVMIDAAEAEGWLVVRLIAFAQLAA
jgi:hypothetical protein